MSKVMRNMGVAMVVVGAVVVTGAHAKFDGFYTGGSVGYMNQSTSIDAKQDPTDLDAHVNKKTAQQGSPMAEIFLGWGRVFGRCFYGGLEGKIDVLLEGSQKVAEDTGFIFHSKRKGLAVGTLARLGYLVTPTTLIYGGVGIKALRIDHNLLEKAGNISAPFSQKTLNLLTEVGIETVVGGSSHWRFRFAYAFMPKKGMTRTTSQFPANHMYRDQGVFKVGGAEHAVKMGMVYRF